MKKYLLLVLVLCVSGVAQARELGHYVPGVANIRDLTVPAAPGFYYEQYNVHYSADKYKDRNGDSVDSFTIGAQTFQVDADVDVSAITSVFLWVTDKKIIGGDYAFYVAPTISQSSVGASLSAFNRSVDSDTDNTGIGDLFVQPLWLGWRDKKYDLSIGLGVYIPVGEYDDDADDNIGVGFWTGQLQGAAYYYLDDQQASALMVSVTYETHTEKGGTDITPGDHIALEYGFSQYLSNRLEIGISGYSQWQTEGDSGSGTLLDPDVKTEVHGLGAQLAYWATPRLNLSAKYMNEYDAEARFEGSWFMLNITYLPGPLF